MFPRILDTGRLSGRGYVTLPRTDAAIFPLAVPSTEMRTRRELKDKFNLFLRNLYMHQMDVKTCRKVLPDRRQSSHWGAYLLSSLECFCPNCNYNDRAERNKLVKDDGCCVYPNIKVSRLIRLTKKKGKNESAFLGISTVQYKCA